MAIQVISNYHYRDLLCWYDLPESEREDFDYVEEEERVSLRFFKYRGVWYDSYEFYAEVPPNIPGSWNAFQSDTFFSGVLIRFSNDFEQVVPGLLLA